jgi:hypothetical protein
VRWLALLVLVGGCDAIFRLDPVPNPPHDATLDGTAVISDGSVDAEPDRILGCPPSYGTYNTEATKYRFVNSVADWQTAQAMCVADRGNYEKFTHLAVFDDDLERSHINAAMSGQVFYIGLTDIRVDFALEWVSTENPLYPPLTAFQNMMMDKTPGADCGVMLGNSDLQMYGCGNLFKYICECDDFPADPSHYEP